MARQTYRQHLPALGLALERGTEGVPADGAWYLLREGRQIGRYKTRDDAVAAWKAVIEESGWEPPPRADGDPAETLRRERAEYWARNRAG
jgi:hypothetical protein